MKRKVFYPGSKVRHSPFKYLILGQGYMSEYSSVLTHSFKNSVAKKKKNSVASCHLLLSFTYRVIHVLIPAHLYSWILPSLTLHTPAKLRIFQFLAPAFSFRSWYMQNTLCQSLFFHLLASFMFRTCLESLYWYKLAWVLSSHPFIFTILLLPQFSSHAFVIR